MSKLLFAIALVVFLSASTFSQQTTTPQKLSNADYLKKSKNQKTAAWVCLGGGSALFLTGYAIFPKNYNLIFGNPEEDDQTFLAGALLLIGSSAMLTSIPLFGASVKNKRRGAHASASLKIENFPTIQKAMFVKSNYPALSFRISLNR